ncbi:hypothetical protein PG997_001613 [Apiospora hydei]|uniref:F-box domain-containing protein n=1 Tax=Apiospora hydei TaxID=1337664 RepID=A0ABR1XE18_9PEZI
MEHLPEELIGAITSYVGAVKHVPPGDETLARRAKTDPEGRQNLANLRRVNKVFHRCATPLLFRHISATVYGLVRLREVSVRPDLAEHVRHDLAGLLGPCLARLPNLASLDFVVGGKASLRELPPKLNDALIKALASALLYVELPGLRELDMSFPIARDFEQLAHADDEPRLTRIRLGPRVLGRLRHLGLHVKAWTSASGQQRHWPVPIDPAYAVNPHDMYAHNVVRLVERADKLESLALGSTEILDLGG